MADRTPQRKDAKRISATTAVIGLMALLLTLLTIAGSYAFWREYREVIALTELRAADFALTASEHARWVIGSTREALRRVDDALGSDPANFAKMDKAVLAEAVSSLPGQPWAWVFDAQGHALLTTSPTTAQDGIADREYFQALRDGAPWRISTLINGRSTHRKVFVIARRLERAGRFAGAVMVVIPSTLMEDFWHTLNLEPGSTTSLIRDDGWVIARFPTLEETMNVKESPVFAEDANKNQASGVYTTTSVADGVVRVVGYYRVPDLPLIAAVGISRAAALAPFWSRMLTFGLLGLLLTAAFVLAVAGAVLLLRRDERTRAQLEVTLEQNKMLLREVHHRVKNNLQVVGSLISLQEGASRESKDELNRRIRAISDVHELLYISDEFSRVDLAQYLRKAVEGLKQSYGAPVTVQFDLVTLYATIELAMPLALIVSEVASNALKHAFPGGRAGTLTVTLNGGDGSRAHLSIQDNGVGFDTKTPAKGLGMKLLAGFCQQIGAEYRFQNLDGTRFDLYFPLNREAPLPRTRPAAAAQ